MNETTETTQESREIAWCCSACEDAGHIVAGHFACSMPEIPAGWAITTDCGYTDGGWRAIIERIMAAPGNKPRRPGGRALGQAQKDRLEFMKIDFLGGTRIAEACAALVKAANETHGNAHGDFNGIGLVAHEGADANDIVEAYLEAYRVKSQERRAAWERSLRRKPRRPAPASRSR